MKHNKRRLIDIIPSHEELDALKENFEVVDGELYWKSSLNTNHKSGRKMAGKIAGGDTDNQFSFIMLEGKRYRRMFVLNFLKTGVWDIEIKENKKTCSKGKIRSVVCVEDPEDVANTSKRIYEEEKRLEAEKIRQERFMSFWDNTFIGQLIRDTLLDIDNAIQPWNEYELERYYLSGFYKE